MKVRKIFKISMLLGLALVITLCLTASLRAEKEERIEGFEHEKNVRLINKKMKQVQGGFLFKYGV